MSASLRIDKSALVTLAICDSCNWRVTRATPAAAWTACAKHAKAVHHDPHAVSHARAAARQYQHRAKPLRET